MRIKEVTKPVRREFELILSRGELVSLANGSAWALSHLHEHMTQMLSVSAQEIRE